jgi:hypothetical protein
MTQVIDDVTEDEIQKMQEENLQYRRNIKDWSTAAERQVEEEMNKMWWANRIDVRVLRNIAHEWQSEGDEDGTALLEILRGKKGKLNFIEAGGWNCSNETRRILTRAGYAVLNREDALF